MALGKVIPMGRTPRSTVPPPQHTLQPSPSSPKTMQEALGVITWQAQEMHLLRLMVAKLKVQLARSVHRQFGASSERFMDEHGVEHPFQASFLDDAQGVPLDKTSADQAKADGDEGSSSHKRHSADREGAAADEAANAPALDRSLPVHLPREQQVHRPATTAAHHDMAGQLCGCSACGGRLRQIGQEVSEQLEYVPGHFKVIRHVRPKLACVKCEGIFQAPAPSRPIARGLPGPALLAQVVVAKYCDHSPLYRQSAIYARSGVELDRSTLAGWARPISCWSRWCRRWAATFARPTRCTATTRR